MRNCCVHFCLQCPVSAYHCAEKTGTHTKLRLEVLLVCAFRSVGGFGSVGAHTKPRLAALLVCALCFGGGIGRAGAHTKPCLAAHFVCAFRSGGGFGRVDAHTKPRLAALLVCALCFGEGSQRTGKPKVHICTRETRYKKNTAGHCTTFTQSACLNLRGTFLLTKIP